MNAKRKTIAESLFGDTPKEKKSKSLAESLLGKERSQRKPTDLMSYLSQVDPYYDEIMIMSCRADFVTKWDFLREKISYFHKTIADTPFLAVLGLWEEQASKDRVFGQRYKEMMLELLSSGLLHCKDQKNKIITIQDFISPWGECQEVIDDIRCYDLWGLLKREDMVSFYSGFIKWLSEETFGYVSVAEDYDRMNTARRKLPFDMYVRMISELSLRERILVKIFYLGGSRTLEEVLNLMIEDIDFKKHSMKFRQDVVTYPPHLLKDIQEYIEGRKKGFVFISKNNERMNHTVPFRALKIVTSNIGLEPTFTFSDLVKNV